MITSTLSTDQLCLAEAQRCRELFGHKLHDYGVSWRIMRPSSLTDQIYIKISRIRSIQMKGKSEVDEGIEGEFVAIFNYSIIAMIQVELGVVDQIDISPALALDLYNKKVDETLELMQRKNHDYGEAWRQMRLSSIVDLMLSKVYRTKQIEELEGQTIASEGVVANYMDMANYALFSLIKLRQ